MPPELATNPAEITVANQVQPEAATPPPSAAPAASEYFSEPAPEQAPASPATPPGDAPAPSPGATQGRDRDELGRFVASTPPSEQSATPGKPQHDPALVALALDFNEPQEVIDAWTPQELSAFVRGQIAARKQIAPPQTPQAPAEPTLDFGTDPQTGKPLTEADFDPAVVRVLKAQAKQLQELNAKLGHFEQHAQRQAQDARDQAVDGTFAKLDPARYGKGAINALPKDSAERKRRLHVFKMAHDKAGPNAPPSVLARHIEDIDAILYGTPAPAPQPAPAPSANGNGAATLTPAQEKWKNGGLSTPTQRLGARDATGYAQAVEAVAEIQKAQGVSPEHRPEQIAEMFPG